MYSMTISSCKKKKKKSYTAFACIDTFTIDVYGILIRCKLYSKATTESSGYASWEKESAALYGREKNLWQKHGAGLVWFPDPSYMGGSRKAREGRVW